MRFFSAKRQEARDHDQVVEFQPDAVEIEQRGLGFAVRATYWLLLLLFLFAVLWSIFGKLDKIVTARGKLISTGKQIVVGPLVNSVIKELHVEVGQIVSTGQRLVSLDPTFAQADKAQLEVRLASTAVYVARLEAELAAQPFKPTPDMDPTEVALQRRLYDGRADEYKARMDTYDITISRYKSEIESFKRKLASLQKQETATEEMLAMRKRVFTEGADSRLSMLEAESKLALVQSDRESVANDLLLRQQQLQQSVAERSTFVNQWRNDIATKLADARKERDSLQKQLSKAVRYSELAELSSPMDAVVLEMGHFSVGSVATEGESIMTLVPLNMPLEAEFSILTSDIGHISLGDPVRIKLDAYPFQRHGIVEGKLRVVSEDAFMASQKAEAPTYQARAELVKTDLRDVGPHLRLLPGMSLTAEVVVGERSVISYLAYPLIRGIDESLTEP